LSHRRPFATRLLATRPGAFVANKLGRPRARRIASWLTDVIPGGASVLDVGAGLGHIAEALADRGHHVATLDPVWRPLRDGTHHAASATAMPLADRSHDVVLIAFVLHHMPTGSHAAALAEACRVAKQRVVLLEDTFRSPLERRWCHAVDSVLNAEYRGHPHANRTVDDWLAQLTAVGTRAHLHWERRERWLLLPIRHALITGDL
jgi:ubiquinone/menaquinone biosynthesis C-methylase UbiE